MLIITFQNIKTENDVASYEWKVYVNRNLICGGLLHGHNRADGWKQLIREWIDKFG
jgi:hypothetical protein